MKSAVTPAVLVNGCVIGSLVAPIGSVLSSLKLLSILAQHTPQQQHQELEPQQRHSACQQQSCPPSCNQQAVPTVVCLARCQPSGLHQLTIHFSALQQTTHLQQHAASIFTSVSQNQADGMQQQQCIQQYQTVDPQQQQWHRSMHWGPAATGRPQASTVHPAMITSNIVKAETSAELVECVVKHSKDLNHIHIIAALTRAAALWDKTATPAVLQSSVDRQQTAAMENLLEQQQHQANGPQEQLISRQQLRQLMLMLAGPLQRSVPLMSCRELASGLWAYATCQLQPPPQLLSAVVEHLSSWDGLKDAEVKHILTVGWSAVKLGCLDRQLYAAITAAMQQHAAHLMPHQVSILLWMLARAEFRHQHLLQQLSGRARELLQHQHQHQQVSKLSRAAARRWRQQQFEPAAICNTVWGLANLGWCDPDVFVAAADLASSVPFVYDIKPHDAVSLLKGLAIAGGTRRIWNASSSSNSSSGVGGASSSDQVTTEEQGLDTDVSSLSAAVSSSAAASAAASSHSSSSLGAQLWPAACAVAAAALRRLAEAGPSDVPRLLWSIAALHKAAVSSHQRWQPQQQQHLNAAATADGSAVFEQLCIALLRQWHNQAVQPTSLTVTAWALVDAQESGLVQLLQQAGQREGGGVLAHFAPSAAPASPDGTQASPAQQLLLQVADVVVQSSQQAVLQPDNVADLAAAFERLWRCNSALHSNTSSNSADHLEGLPELTEATATEMRKTTADTPHVQSHLTTAVGALASAAEELAAASTAGGLGVYDVSKMVAAFGCMRVHKDTLYQALLRHWTPQQLAACSSETLVGSLRAVSAVHNAMPHLIQDGVMPVELWQQLLELCMQRWRHLSTEQRIKLQFVACNVPTNVNQQLPDMVAAFTQAVAGLSKRMDNIDEAASAAV